MSPPSDKYRDQRRPSSRSSSSSSSTTTAASIFDENSSRSSSPCTIPDRTEMNTQQFDTFHQLAADNNFVPNAHDLLPCNHCDQTFDLHQDSQWIDHIIQDHLDRDIPLHFMCRVCKEHSKAPQQTENRQQWYGGRLEHLAGHFEGYFGIKGLSPDFYLDYHLWNCGKITSQQLIAKYEDAGFDMENYRPLTWQPPKVIRKEELESRYPVVEEKRGRHGSKKPNSNKRKKYRCRHQVLIIDNEPVDTEFPGWKPEQ